MTNITGVLVQDLWDLRDQFRASGFDLKLVGGCVRDLLLGIEPKDVDLHTDATPDECVQIYEKAGVRYELTGMQHGTITVIFDHVGYEITSLRTDVETDGRHATVAYTRDWLVDLERRDFTMNAMSMSFEGDILDPFGGEQDLRDGVVRFVGDADKRIQEDYLRILRWFRFRGRFEKGGHLTLDMTAVIRNARGLTFISRERVWSEVSKILAGERGPELMWEIHGCGVSHFLNLPHLDSIRDAQEVHKVTRNPVTLMVRLYGEEAQLVLRKWKASNDEIKLAKDLDWALGWPAGPFYCMAMKNWSRENALELAAMLEMGPFERAVLESWEVPVFPVGGDDLIALGMKPGPKFSHVLNTLKCTWADHDYSLTKDQLLETLGD